MKLRIGRLSDRGGKFVGHKPELKEPMVEGLNATCIENRAIPGVTTIPSMDEKRCKNPRGKPLV